MKTFWRAVVEVGFIIFLFYSNLLMGEFERSGAGRIRGFQWALADIFTKANLAIAIIASAIGYMLVELIRSRLWSEVGTTERGFSAKRRWKETEWHRKRTSNQGRPITSMESGAAAKAQTKTEGLSARAAAAVLTENPGPDPLHRAKRHISHRKIQSQIENQERPGSHRIRIRKPAVCRLPGWLNGALVRAAIGDSKLPA